MISVRRRLRSRPRRFLALSAAMAALAAVIVVPRAYRPLVASVGAIFTIAVATCPMLGPTNTRVAPQI